MNTLQNLRDELKHEYETTKKFIANYPEGKNQYAPHEKSMKMMPLATHIAEVFAWPAMILNTAELDFAKGDYQPTILNTKAELQKKLDEDYNAGKAALETAQESALDSNWKMRSGDQVLAEWSKYGAIRHALDQIIHHRAQLGVYYRMNDIPVPASYGPSADEKGF
ncbi:DinB family protein [Chryseobacterium koreense]|uniref:Damage-inducible protein DinB n=1 Tax=Chryseobacterium koreense CCUG 49689 TaxID=1304281 RepID=A0A0J7IYQ2_9FLAO|nr:DinB family protein [Chryseobacterium koreense]KMQ71383.1 damage-inducible protein DinB [Chryseobacterium koreense CCUG 49689]MBB5332222.1 putative damage-inducible protein DinB [Chryseobacterium koreense]